MGRNIGIGEDNSLIVGPVSRETLPRTRRCVNVGVVTPQNTTHKTHAHQRKRQTLRRFHSDRDASISRRKLQRTRTPIEDSTQDS